MGSQEINSTPRELQLQGYGLKRSWALRLSLQGYLLIETKTGGFTEGLGLIGLNFGMSANIGLGVMMVQCRICEREVHLVLDLGHQPFANALLDTQDQSEARYPLKFHFCYPCQYGMVPNLDSSHIFDDTYPYYSSVGESYVKQCEGWAKWYREYRNPTSVLEIGSNDGYMLQNFKDLRHLGIEPSVGPLMKAKALGLRVTNEFFTNKIYDLKYDLIIANNVLAHTPRLLEMAEGIAMNLNDEGEAVIEFPHLHNLIYHGQYDTIYHEHFSYFTLRSIALLFMKFGLYIQRVDKLTSHGGSARVYLARRVLGDTLSEAPIDQYKINNFVRDVQTNKWSNSGAILTSKHLRQKLALFGAAAKGNTWLNYLGLTYQEFDFVVDETPYKQGKFLPGSRIPILGLDAIKEHKPNLLWILPWNFKDEIMKKCEFIKEWGGEFRSR